MLVLLPGLGCKHAHPSASLKQIVVGQPKMAGRNSGQRVCFRRRAGFPVFHARQALDLYRSILIALYPSMGQGENMSNDVFENLSERQVGCILLVATAALAYFSVYSPLVSAIHHESEVSLSMKGVGIMPTTLVMGLAYAVFGEQASKFLGKPREPSVGGWVLLSVLVVVGFVAYSWFKKTIEGYGYSF
jgi:hypothetical protein